MMRVRRVPPSLLIGICCIVLRSTSEPTVTDVLATTFVSTTADPTAEEDDAPLQRLETNLGSRGPDPRTHHKDLDTASDFGSLFSDFPGLHDFPGISELLRTITTTPAPPPLYQHHLSEYVSQRQRPQASLPLLDRPDITSRMPSSIVDEPPKTARQSSETPYLFPKARTKVAAEDIPKAESFPKIFRFNNDRVNIADFDHLKKVQKTYNSLSKGDALDPDRIQRNKFLILHGGVYNHEEPLSFGRFYEAQSHPSKTVANLYEFSPPRDEKPRGYSFFYRTK